MEQYSICEVCGDNRGTTSVTWEAMEGGASLAHDFSSLLCDSNILYPEGTFLIHVVIIRSGLYSTRDHIQTLLIAKTKSGSLS